MQSSVDTSLLYCAQFRAQARWYFFPTTLICQSLLRQRNGEQRHVVEYVSEDIDHSDDLHGGSEDEYDNDAGDSGLSAPGNDERSAPGTTVFARYLAGATPGDLAEAAGAKDQQSVWKFSSQHHRPRSDFWF